MGQQPELEALTDDGLFSIDIALPEESEQDGRLNTAVEVDGPQHYTSSGGKTGSTQLREFLLEQRGWRVVSLPYFAIDAASTDTKLAAYLEGALHHHKPRKSFPTMWLRLSSSLMPCPASPPSPRSPLPFAALDLASPKAPTASTPTQHRLNARAPEFIPSGASQSKHVR